MFYFTLLSSEVAWLHLHLGIPITNTIPPRLLETAPSTIPSLSLMSTSPTPSTQVDNSPSNMPVDPMEDLIALMTQQLYKKNVMMAQLQRQQSSPQVATTQMNMSCKIQCPPLSNVMGRPRQNHYYFNKLRLTSTRHTIQAPNIGLTQGQLPNT